MYQFFAERTSVSSSLIIWSSSICSNTADLSVCASLMSYLYDTHIRLVQTDKTVVGVHSINQHHTIKLTDIKILSAKSRNAHTISPRLFFLLTRPTNNEQAECSETSAHTVQMEGYQPKKKRIQYSEQGESLKSRIFNHSHNIAITFLCFRERKRKTTKHPEYLTQIKRINGRSRFEIISTKDGSTRDQCCFDLHIRHRPFIGFDLLLEMETLF